jgi:hypothetical protein
MRFELKENIVFDTFNDQTELKETILKFIFDSKTDKILYKGDPREVNYKLLKKILPNESSVPELKLETEKTIRENYNDFLGRVKSDHCLIYKVK